MAPPAQVADSQLWSDKYKSEKFFDLLTDETVNRNVLTWLKSWDEIVFPNKSKVNLKLPDVANTKQNLFKKDMSFRKVAADGTVSYISAEQEFCYQNQKILTLYGPPGTGKTTMARVLARQCGYETREINGSDVRSPAQLLDQIKNGLTNNSHYGAEEKPVCLIIDEVDGALQGGIGGGFSQITDFLKKCLLKTKSAAPKDDDSGDQLEEDEQQTIQKTKKKKKDNSFELKRPIIFICNDLYAKAIRPLREISIQVKIQEANQNRLIQRMRYICKQENANFADSIIKDLAAQSNYDARSAINSL